MSPLMRSECRKFAPNIFNKTKCTNCFRQKEEHSAEALESNRATRKVCKCGYLFVAPDWDFSNPINRTKRWQRRWFILYDDGELTYSVDEHPDTVPQAVISLLSSTGQGGGSIVWEAPESETGHPHSLAIAAPERIHFVRGDSREETKAWLASLLAVASPLGTQGTTRIRQARHKRNATFPGGRSNPLPMGVPQAVISGTTAVSQQHSPVLRQRFNSCISPLHHDLPSITGEEEVQHSHSSPMCKTSASASLSELSSSPIKKSPGDLLSTPRNEESPLFKSLISAADSSSFYVKEIDNSDVYLTSSQIITPNNRLCFGVKSESDLDGSKATKSTSNENENIDNESTKCSLAISWRRHSSLSDERPASSGVIMPSEKNVRGDPDGCVLDSIPICCSVEGSGHVVGVLSKQITFNESHESKATKNTEEPILKKDHPWRNSVGKDATKHGWLMKLGVLKEWSKHWFVLRGTGLLYYRDPSAEGSGILDGVLDLGLVHDVREVAVERNHGLQLTTWDGKQYILSAITPGIRTGWIEALRKAAGLPSSPQKTSSPRHCDRHSDMGTSVANEGLNQPHVSESFSQTEADLTDSSQIIPIDSPSAFETPIHSKPDAEEIVQLHVESHFVNASALELSSSQVKKDCEDDLIGNKLCSSLCNSELNSNFPSGSVHKIDSLLRETSSYVGLEPVLSGVAEILLDSKESSYKCYADQVSVSKISAECSQSSNEQVNPVLSVINSRSTIHKPPVSPVFNSNCTRTSAGRRNSNGFRLQGYERSLLGNSTTDSSSDCKKLERPNHLSLPPCESNGSKCAASCPSSSYISSSASSCSLSDEDFRTASEASQHSTPVAEGVIDDSSNLWAKSEASNVRVDAPSSSLLPSAGADVGTILPPSPPLNRTPISRVKERARSRVVKRSKTPPEEDLKSAKIESLTKRVKELMAALASKETELMKTKESLIKKRSSVELEPKSKMPLLSSDENTNEIVSALKENTEDEINSLTLCNKASIETAKLNEYEENSSHLSLRRLSSSSVAIHSLPRMGSLSDLTNVDLDLDLNVMDRERLIEEWFGLRARFEKAVREIHALRKELRTCQGRVDALELEGSAMSMCLAEERKRADADMQLMASRIQDLTIKLSASEKQVRQLKQKTLRVEMKEKRRSLSLRSERDGRSATDPSLCSEKLPKEICDRLSQLEDTLAATLGTPFDKLKVSFVRKSDSSASCDEKASSSDLPKGADSNKDSVDEAGSSNSLNRLLKELDKVRLEEQTISGTINNTNVAGTPSSHVKSSGIGSKGEKVDENERKCVVWKPLEGCSASERRRIEGRRQRVNSRIMRRSAWQEAESANSSAGGRDEENVEEERRGDDRKCDPLRILVRLSSLEGRVADFLKTSKNGNKMENSSVDEVLTNKDKKTLEYENVPENPCLRCEDMRVAMDRMKEELMLVNNDGSVMLDRYREEIEQLRALCEKGMRAMDLSHQRLIKEMEEKHREEVNRVLLEKEQALREETKATLAALDAMRKAHETEVQREVAKFKEEFSRRMSAKQELSTNHQAEMEGIRREILSLSQRYSSKCVECASLREQLRIARGLKDPLNESGAYREVLS